MQKKITYLFSLAIIALIVGCSDYSKVVKNGTTEEKKDFALSAYEKGEYLKAVTLLEEVIPFYKLSPEGENLYFTYCLANYKLEDYYLSGYYFKRFVRQYPSSKNVEEALFMSALCSVQNSPEYQLDQTETLNALDQIQIFVDLFPNSTRIDTCNIIIDNLRGKLERKEYEGALLYYNTSYYKAAVVSFNSTLDNYPNTVYKEEILYYLVLSHFELAINSVPDKKEERLNATLKSIDKFVASYPTSKYVSEVDGIRKKTEAELLNFEK